MKKIVYLCMFAFLFTFHISAQDHENDDHKMTVEQQTEIAVKKMTLRLDLSPSQENSIRPLLAEKIAKRKEIKEAKKASKKENTKLSIHERYNMKIAKLDDQIAFKADMKRILNEEQYERFEKLGARKACKVRKRGKRKMQHKNEKKDN